TANAMIGLPSNLFPAGNFFPSGTSAVGFTNTTTRDYTLTGSSPYKAKGTDGKDLGADISAMNTAITCAVSGQCSGVGGGGGGGGGDTTPPTVSVTAPTAGATLTGTVTLTATASDDTGVVGVQFRANGQNAGAEDTSGPPYSISWNSASVADG